MQARPRMGAAQGNPSLPSAFVLWARCKAPLPWEPLIYSAAPAAQGRAAKISGCKPLIL